MKIDSIYNIEFLIKSSVQIEKLLIEVDKNNDISNIYFRNCLLRINNIMQSVNILNENAIQNKFSIYILLRPLTLDFMFFYYIINFEIVKKSSKNDQLLYIEKMAFNHLIDGVKEYHSILTRNISSLDKLDREIFEQNFKKIYKFAIKNIPNNFSSIIFHEKYKEIPNVSVSNIMSKIKDRNDYVNRLAGFYSLFSKYDHNTGVGFIDYISSKEHVKSIEDCIVYLRKGYMNLLFLIDLKNDIADVRKVYMTEFGKI